MITSALIAAALVLTGPATTPTETTTTHRISLVSVSTPETGSPSDRFVRQQGTEIVSFWSQLGIVVEVAPVIQRARLATDDDTPMTVTAAVPEVDGVVNVVVSAMRTGRCWSAAGTISIGNTGDCAAHEYGHTLGLGHSRGVLQGLGMMEYGNPYSVMGGGDGLPDYAQLELLGLVPPAPAPGKSIVLKRTGDKRTVVAWNRGESRCYLEVRGSVVMAYSTDDGGRDTEAQAPIRLGQDRFVCGRWISFEARSTTSIAMGME